MIYVDTSVWIALQLREAKTDAVQAWFVEHGMSGLACSEWVKTEYASALSIKRRRGDIDEDHFTRAHQTFRKIWVSGLTWLTVETPDFTEAANLCANPVALRYQCTEFLSLDIVLNDNAKRLGMGRITL